MKRTLVAVLVCALLVAWFLVSPFLGIARLRAAVEARNPASLEERVDFRRLRISLGTQIVSAYLKLTGKAQQFGSLGSVLATSVGASLADPLLSDVLTPEAMLDFLSGAKSSPIPTGDVDDMLNLASVDTVWKAFANSEYGVGNFYVSAPLDKPPTDQFRLRFQVLQWNWKLTAVDLPEHVRIRLAQELQKRIGS
jgi:hypothetical protein